MAPKLSRPRLRTGPPTPPRTQKPQSSVWSGDGPQTGRTNSKREPKKKDYNSQWESRCPNYYRVNWEPCFLRVAGSDVTSRATSRALFSRGGRAQIAEEQGGARAGKWVATVRRERAGVRGSWGAEPARWASRVRPHRPGPLRKKETEQEGSWRADPRTER